MATTQGEVPGTGETTSQDDDQGILQCTREQEREIKRAAKRLKEIQDERADLTAEKRSILEGIVADKVSRKSIERAVKDVEKDADKLEREDFWYTKARAILGKPVQMELLPDTLH